jgi:hypothetical protein
MAIKGAMVVALVLIGSLFSIASMIPTVGAESQSGTSPEFMANEAFTVNLTVVNTEIVVQYDFFSDDYLEFWVDGPQGFVDYYYPQTYDVAYSSGFAPNEPGNYSFKWTNHNIVNPAIVTYAIEWFTPSLELTTPKPESLIHELNPNLIGTCDEIASGVNVSVNNVTFFPAQKQGGNWMATIQLQSGSNNIFVASDYRNGDFAYRFVKQFSITTGFGLDFEPWLLPTDPAPGSTIPYLSTVLSGICDENASYLNGTMNHVPFQVYKNGDHWYSSEVAMVPGPNHVRMTAFYFRGDFGYNNSWYYDVISGFGLDFVPSIELVSPAPGSKITDLTPVLNGSCDENATLVIYSLDNWTFYYTTKNGPNWMSESRLSPGENTIYVKAIYQRGVYWFNCTKTFTVNVDTTWVYQEDGNSKLGIGAIAAIVAAIAIVAVIGVALILRRRGKKP